MTQKSLPLNKRNVSLLIGSILGTSIAGATIEPDFIMSVLSSTMQNQIAQAGFFFTMAAWIHSGRVKKEIKSNFESLTSAIESVASAFREDLKLHSERLDNLAKRVENLEKVSTDEEQV